MRALPASPFAEMSVSIVGNNHLATTTINTSGGGGGSSSSSSGCSSSLEDDHFGQVAYKLSLLCSAGSSTSTTTSTSNGVASDGSDNVENHLSFLSFSPQHHQQQQHQQQQQAQPLGMNGGAGVSPSSVPTTGAFDDNCVRTNGGKRSANMTECVRVPSSEHVAEIVGRQGCKIKALRAKTNTYIKTPVRGEEPVFVVTGRREDVCAAKREIVNAAQHFTQIRASRRGSSTSSFGSNGSVGPSSPALGPGQTTIKVAVPYRVVGLVVGPKGATIKRIQQQTHTYIVTPSRDKEPIFEVTGTPENVQAAKREIEAHIANRTGGLVDTTNIPDYQPPTALQQQHHHHHHQQQQHSSSTASQTASASQHHLGHAAAAGGVIRGSGILQNGGLLHSQPSSNLFQHQNEHLFQHHNDRYGAAAFGLEGRRMPGTSVVDDFDSNGHDAIFNDVSGSLNGVGGGDALGFGSSSSDYMYGGGRHDAGGATAASGSGQFGHYTGGGVVNGGELIGRLSGSAQQDATSAFVFPPHEPYPTVNGYLQQNGHGHVTNGYEGGGGEDASSSCLAGLEPLLGSPPTSWFNGRPSSFSSSRSGPVCSTSLSSLFCSKGNFSSCDDVIAPSSSLLHRRSSSFAGGLGNSFALDSDLTSAPVTARYSPPTAPLLSDFVNGAGAINGIHHGAGTPPLNGSTSPQSVSSSGFSSSGPATGDDPTSMLEQAAHASRRMRSLPLATASLKAALSSLSVSYSSNPSTALTPLSHSSQELSASPPPVDLVGLSLSENLDLLPACERNGSSSSSSNSSSSTSSSSSSVATPTAPCCMSGADDGKVELRRCVVCRERPTVAALVPCGHNLFCMECASKLLEMPQEKRVCPACDEPFSQAIRIRAQ